MKKELFEEFAASVREAGSIHRGEQPPSRTFEVTPEEVRGIREGLHKSQSEFAQMIGVSVPTLQNWEQGRRSPQGAARALLFVVSREPRMVARVLASPLDRTYQKPSAKRRPASAGNSKPTRRRSAPRAARPKHS